ncbi:MAG: DUF3160 domain-containing protein [Prevotella sp.]|nr:DUF3160 domain-containing protein [Prevotella sp.]
MKTKTYLMLCLAGLVMACSQKTSVVSVPVSHIDVEQLKDSIDYNMDVSGLPISDLLVLSNAPAARQGFPFKDAYIRGVYESTTWYDSLMWKFDEKTNFEGIEQKENESWRDFYYRASQVKGLIKYTQEEQDFMKRLQERVDELKKQNFDTPEDLRVNMGNLINPKQLKEFDSLLCQHLAEDGFAIIPATHDQLFHVYEQNDYQEFPSFVTTDLFLQLYHLYFDCMLKEIEEQELSKLMIDMTRDMYNAMHQQAADTNNEEIWAYANHNAVFFAVAYQLLTGKTIGTAEEQAEAKPEVEKAMKTEDDFSEFMEDYKGVKFAYSLFRPRGHYSRTEALQRYFRGMMWLQSVPFGVKNPDELREAVVMAYALENSPSAKKNYDTFNKLITFLMGQPDNLSIPQVQAEIKKIGLPMEALLNDQQKMTQLKEALEKIGEEQIRIRPPFEKTSHNKICLMPQRYQPDAEVLLKTVDYENKPTLRGVPKGLDFFAAMGVSAAEQILMEEKQDWKDLKSAINAMKKRMGEIDWQETIATQWMNTLKVLNDKGENLPYFMVTPEWDKKNMNAVLASWAELKHDAILYAKQPFGAECGGGGLPEPMVKGYVEPNVNFWKKAIELLNNTEKLLKEQNMLTEKVNDATSRIREEAQFLLVISEKELAGTPLTDEECDQIECIGSTFENISLDLIRQPDQYLDGWSNVEGADKKVALVADVYTANADNNPNKSILFEAVGDADEIYVVVEIDGYLYLTRGAVLSYREFTQPLGEQRLTDEEWQQQLEKNPRKGVPEWMNRIIVPLKKMPEANEDYFYSSGC